MAARFILSIDCEGKWGVADHIGPAERRYLTDNRLRDAYGSILSTLQEYGVPATFAFVGLYGESSESFNRIRSEVEALTALQPRYLRSALSDMDERGGDGWHGHWAVDAVGSADLSHEIALHGITHVPWGEVDRNFALAELALHPLLSNAARMARTFVAPRNQVAHVDLLRTIGIEGYREAPRIRSGAASLLSELNLWLQPQSDPPQLLHGLVPIPSGYFVNWQHGLRQLIPMELSVHRFKRVLAVADRVEAIVHFWFHPENVASAPTTLKLLRMMLAHVANRRDAGNCKVLTQAQYVEARRKI